MLRHPFTMVGTLEDCLIFNFSVPAEVVRPLVPEPLDLVTYHGCAFWHVVVARLRRLRPWPLPGICGLSYRQVSYRLQVSFTPPDGEPIHGQYTTRSDVASRLVTGLEHLFGDYRCHRAKVELRLEEGQARLRVAGTLDGQADAEARVDLADAATALPAGSRFPSYETAVKVLNCAPRDLSYDPIRQEIDLGGPARDDRPWPMQPVKVLESRWQYLSDSRHGGEGLRLEPAFWIGPIPYRRPRLEVIRVVPEPLLPQPFSAMPLSRRPAQGASVAV